MKKIIYSIFALCLLGCEFSEKRAVDIQQEEKQDIERRQEIVKSRMETIVFDSCEYIGYVSGFTDTSFLTHKGNCKFCKERNKKNND